MFEITKIIKLVNKSIDAMVIEDYDTSYNYTQKIINVLKKSDNLSNDKITKIYGVLSTYTKSLSSVANYQNDTGEENKAIILLTDFVLDSSFSKKVTTTAKYVDFYFELIFANIAIKRIKTSLKIYWKYESQLNDHKRTVFIKRMLIQSSGELSYDKIFSPWLNKIATLFNEYDTGITNESDYDKKNYIYFVNTILLTYKKMDYSIDKYISMINKLIDSLHGEYNPRIHELMTKCADNNKLNDSVINWFNSGIEISENQNTSLKELCDNLGQEYNNITIKEDNNAQKTLDADLELYEKMVKDKNTNRQLVDVKVDEIITKLLRELKGTKSVSQRSKYLFNLFSFKHKKRYSSFWSDFSEELSKIEQPKESDTLYLFVNDYSLVNGALALPILLEASKQGCYIAPTSPRTFNFQSFADPELNDLVGVMDIDNYLIEKNYANTKYDWKIDLDNKEITYENFNIYQPIYEFISRYQFSYFLKYEEDAYSKYKVKTYILYMERIIRYCEKIAIYARKNNLKVRFISNAPHFPHAASYRIYCEAIGYKQDMNFIVLSPGYDNYFNNIGAAESETLTALNMTKNPDSRNSFLGTKSGFDQYYIDHIDKLSEFKDITKKWLLFQRSSVINNDETGEKKRIVSLIQKYKSEGKKVYLLNGKIIFDLGIKYTKGCCHSDMSDWITHTVKTINKNKDVLLLIKPHPHEQRRDITMTSEKAAELSSIIKADFEDNVIYLDSSMFKISELVDHIDLGIMWNGTSSLEFAAQNIKTVVCDEWGHLDYPIGFIRTDTRKEYESLLNDCSTYKISEGLQDRAIMFLNYMGSDEVRIYNHFSKTSTLNYHQFTKSRVFPDAVDNYLKNGDVNLKCLFNKIN